VSSFFEVLFFEKFQVDEVVSLVKQFGEALETQDDTSDKAGGVEIGQGLNSDTELLQ
jgi:hypothetical protein